GSPRNIVGGSEPGAGNIIAFNGTQGVYIAGPDNTVLGNSIFANGGLGIDVNSTGTDVNPNDPGDADHLQNYPVLTSASSTDNTVTVVGILDSTANTNFRVEFFANAVPDPSGFGEGQRYLGFTTVT